MKPSENWVGPEQVNIVQSKKTFLTTGSKKYQKSCGRSNVHCSKFQRRCLLFPLFDCMLLPVGLSLQSVVVRICPGHGLEVGWQACCMRPVEVVVDTTLEAPLMRTTPSRVPTNVIYCHRLADLVWLAGKRGCLCSGLLDSWMLTCLQVQCCACNKKLYVKTKVRARNKRKAQRANTHLVT